MQDYILGADVIGVDETWWRLMDKKASKRWWVWGLATPDTVWFGIDESRSAKTAEGILGDFEGTIVCDGYKAPLGPVKSGTLSPVWIKTVYDNATGNLVTIHPTEPVP